MTQRPFYSASFVFFILQPFSFLSQSLSPRLSASVKAASLRRCGACRGPCRTSSASPWSSEEPGRAWTWCAPARLKPSAGYEGSARWRNTWPTWLKKKSSTNIQPDLKPVNIAQLRQCSSISDAAVRCTILHPKHSCWGQQWFPKKLKIHSDVALNTFTGSQRITAFHQLNYCFYEVYILFNGVSVWEFWATGSWK